MIKTLAIALCLFSMSACLAQTKPSAVLLSNNEITSLFDSLPRRLSLETADGVKAWRPKVKFIDSISVHRITYLSDGLKINGFLVQPKRPGNYPCIIWNRGGVREFGALNVRSAAGMIGRLASAGYVVVASQYRGNGGSEGQEEYGGGDINDVLKLVDVLAELPMADTSRIGMFGGSRGGMMTYMALPKTNRIKAAAVLGAPSDKRASIADRPALEKNLQLHVKGYTENTQEALDKRSAIQWPERFPKDVPLLIMHGSSDWRVKAEQSLRMALALDEQRVPYRLKIYEGGDHGLSEFRGEFFTDLIKWFDRYVKTDTALPNMEFHGR